MAFSRTGASAGLADAMPRRETSLSTIVTFIGILETPYVIIDFSLSSGNGDSFDGCEIKAIFARGIG